VFLSNNKNFIGGKKMIDKKKPLGEKIADYYKTVVVTIFVLVMIWGVFIITYNVFYPSDLSHNITLNIIGIDNATNSSIVSIHFECLKVCNKQFSNDGSKLRDCWKECEKIGMR
jgi:hypothetical protein